MSTTMKLKLTGIASFIATITQGKVVKRGQVARFDHADGAKLLLSVRKDKEGGDLPYFKELDGDEKVDFDFSTAPVKQRERETAGDEDAAPVAAKTTVSRQRKTVSTHAAA